MPTQSTKIIYVEDDPALGRLVQKALSRHGSHVEHVTSARCGLLLLAAGDADVLVVDHYLADGTGLDMLEKVVRRADAPPVIYVTASTDAAIAVAALKAGAADYVLKSVGEDFVELLRSAIDQAIATSRLQRARERAEQEMREARERAEMALAEVNHRVANSLALVAALVRMQMTAVADPAAKEALAETQGRITAIAGIHRRLYTNDDVRFVEIDAYLGNLAKDIQASMSLDGSPVVIRLIADPLRLPTDKAVSVGVIVNELVTNAAKYAYTDRQPGEIRIRAGVTGPGKLEIAVEDDGIGWTGQGKVHGTGVGSRVIAATASGLGATLLYDSVTRGTCARLMIEI